MLVCVYKSKYLLEITKKMIETYIWRVNQSMTFLNVFFFTLMQTFSKMSNSG